MADDMGVLAGRVTDAVALQWQALVQALESCQERRLAAEQRAGDYSQIVGALVRRLGGRVTVHADELELPPAELVVHHRVGGGGVDIELRGL